MPLQDVIKSIIGSYNITSDGIINLLGISKKRKEEAVERAFWDFTRENEAVVLLSVSTSSKLFQYILSHVPHIWFVEGRITDQNKRKDVLALIFTYHKFTV